jgi:hypothetical protein
MEEGEVGGGNGKCVQKFWLESLKGRDQSEGLGLDGRITLIWVLEKCCCDVDWIDLAQNKNL